MLGAMHARLIIQLEDFPEEGRYLQGEVDGAVFGIDNDEIRSAGPIRYEFDTQLYENELVLRGSLATEFDMRCNRCLAHFAYTAEIPDLTLSFDVKGKACLDVTEALREELVLVLPSYPKCEHAGLDCEENDIIRDFRLAKDPETGVELPTPSGNSVWDALDKLPK